MSCSARFDSKNQPKCKVELHVHLDGSVRLETIWELSQKKNICLANNIDELRNKCSITKPVTLQAFLKPIRDCLPVICGHADAIERIAYEYCEDAAKEGILYAEVRYSPHLFSSTHGPVECSSSGQLTPRDVVKHVNKGLSKGSKDFGIKVRSILCTIRGKIGWAEEVLRLCHEFRDNGVVAIDIFGCEEHESEEDIAVFKLAQSMKIHRTVHAGKDGPAEQVQFAREVMLAERIGHGYNVIENQTIYSKCLKDNVHFETCPLSSMMIISSFTEKHTKHPIVRFAEDGANFSISRDDPTLIQKSLDAEYDFLKSMGLSNIHFTRANFNAAKNSFLPEQEKIELLNQLADIYGVNY